MNLLLIVSIIGAMNVLAFWVRSVIRSLSAHTLSIPGPLSARFSRLRFFRTTIRGDFEQDNLKLHQKHGKIVRIAPRTFSIDDPDAVGTIYGIQSKFTKSNWYSAFEKPGNPNLFSERSIRRHAVQRRKYSGAYTMSSMTSYEVYVDECIALLLQRLRELAESEKPFDMGWWLQCFAFDVIGYITFSERFGLLDKGEDVKGLIKAIHSSQILTTAVSVYPRLWPLLFSVFNSLGKLGFSGSSAQFLSGKVERRKWREREAMVKSSSDGEMYAPGPRDFLAKFLKAQREGGDFSVQDALGGLSTNIAAGSDTTGIALAAILYYLFRNPQTLGRLRQELKRAEDSGKISNPITFSESQNLEYLQAVIKEALRLWPSFSMPLFRVVPTRGALISDQYFEEGDVVGINPWVAHRNPTVFGPDVEKFRPERWLTRPQDRAQSPSSLERYWIPFGMGSRTCIGKNVSLLEIGKLVPEVVRGFDLSLDPGLVRDGPESSNISFLTWRNFVVQARAVS